MRSSSAIVEGTVGCAGVKERCSRHHDILSFVYCNLIMFLFLRNVRIFAI